MAALMVAMFQLRCDHRMSPRMRRIVFARENLASLPPTSIFISIWYFPPATPRNPPGHRSERPHPNGTLELIWNRSWSPSKRWRRSTIIMLVIEAF
jgi:NADPH-dependent ferric siderophore reductase